VTLDGGGMNSLFPDIFNKSGFHSPDECYFPIFLGKSGFHSSDERHFSYLSWQKWFSFV